MAHEFTSDNFANDVLESDVPVLADFWATWCPPCRALSPVIDQLSQEVGDKFRIGKINVDEQPELASRYGIRSIPTLLVFKNGEPVKELVGVQPKQAIVGALESVA